MHWTHIALGAAATLIIIIIALIRRRIQASDAIAEYCCDVEACHEPDCHPVKHAEFDIREWRDTALCGDLILYGGNVVKFMYQEAFAIFFQKFDGSTCQVDIDQIASFRMCEEVTLDNIDSDPEFKAILGEFEIGFEVLLPYAIHQPAIRRLWLRDLAYRLEKKQQLRRMRMQKTGELAGWPNGNGN